MHLSETAEEYGNRMAQQAMQQQGGTSAPSIWDSIGAGLTALSTNVKDIVTPLATARQTYDLYQINRDRLKAGLAPLDPGDLAPTIKHDITSSMLKKNLPLILIGGVLLVFLLRRRG